MVRKYTTRLNIALDPETLRDIDALIADGEYRSRSEAIQDLITEETDDDADAFDDIEDDDEADDDQADDD